jgi:hypothetical protein
MTTKHPLLDRVLGELTLKLIHNGNVWHGLLIEDGESIWQSRGEDTREAVEKSAANFADYTTTEVVEL